MESSAADGRAELLFGISIQQYGNDLNLNANTAEQHCYTSKTQICNCL